MTPSCTESATEQEIVIIEPADPQVIYVPQYNPTTVVVQSAAPVYAYYPTPYPVYYRPYGPLVTEGGAYMKGRTPGEPYRGYYFRILTGQGKKAPGGAYGYVINGRMLAGSAMVAYPAVYGETGVMTFIVSHHGKVYERDLGRDTVKLGSTMASFDPGKGWGLVKPE